jgi:hypothetical protein
MALMSNLKEPHPSRCGPKGGFHSTTALGNNKTKCRFRSAGRSAGKISIIVAHLDLKLSIGKLFTPHLLQPDDSSWLIAVADKKYRFSTGNNGQCAHSKHPNQCQSNCPNPKRMYYRRALPTFNVSSLQNTVHTAEFAAYYAHR